MQCLLAMHPSLYQKRILQTVGQHRVLLELAASRFQVSRRVFIGNNCICMHGFDCKLTAASLRCQVQWTDKLSTELPRGWAWQPIRLILPIVLLLGNLLQLLLQVMVKSNSLLTNWPAQDVELIEVAAWLAAIFMNSSPSVSALLWDCLPPPSGWQWQRQKPKTQAETCCNLWRFYWLSFPPGITNLTTQLVDILCSHHNVACVKYLPGHQGAIKREICVGVVKAAVLQKAKRLNHLLCSDQKEVKEIASSDFNNPSWEAFQFLIQVLLHHCKARSCKWLKISKIFPGGLAVVFLQAFQIYKHECSFLDVWEFDVRSANSSFFRVHWILFYEQKCNRYTKFNLHHFFMVLIASLLCELKPRKWVGLQVLTSWESYSC